MRLGGSNHLQDHAALAAGSRRASDVRRGPPLIGKCGRNPVNTVFPVLVSVRKSTGRFRSADAALQSFQLRRSSVALAPPWLVPSTQSLPGQSPLHPLRPLTPTLLPLLCVIAVDEIEPTRREARDGVLYSFFLIQDVFVLLSIRSRLTLGHLLYTLFNTGLSTSEASFSSMGFYLFQLTSGLFVSCCRFDIFVSSIPASTCLRAVLSAVYIEPPFLCYERFTPFTSPNNRQSQ
ncbi:hypothetical protein VUR80DRAFT_368 [Thermomyces stellatus]